MRDKMQLLAVTFVGLVSAFFVRPVFAQAAPAAGAAVATATPQPDPAVLAIFNKMKSDVSKINGGYVQVSANVQYSMGKIAVGPLPLSVKLWVSGSKGYAQGQGLGVGGIFVTDGKQELNFVTPINQYTLKPTAHPANGSGLPAGAELMKDVKFDSLGQWKLVGHETIDGVAANHLQTGSAVQTVDLWMMDTTQTLPIRATGSMQQGPQGSIKFAASAQYILDKPVPDSIFVINPPPGATKVDTIDGKALMPYVQQAMLGQNAPAPAGAAAAKPAATAAPHR